MQTYSFILREIITCGAVLSTFELCQALNRLGYEGIIVSDYNNKELEEYFDVKVERKPRGITIAVSPRCEGEWAYVRTRDERWKNHKSKKIVVSNYLRDWLGDGIIIGNGTHERFYNMGLVRSIEVLVCGNYEPNKNIDETIKKALKIANGGRVLWFGLHTVPRRDVEFVSSPPLEEIPRLYNISKTMLSMSKSEGWGRPIAEAIACGVPNVINLNGGNKKIEIVSWKKIAKQLIKALCHQRQE